MKNIFSKKQEDDIVQIGKRKFRVHYRYSDKPLDHYKLKQFADWIVNWGIKQGTIHSPYKKTKGHKLNNNSSKNNGIQKKYVNNQFL